MSWKISLVEKMNSDSFLKEMGIGEETIPLVKRAFSIACGNNNLQVVTTKFFLTNEMESELNKIGMDVEHRGLSDAAQQITESLKYIHLKTEVEKDAMGTCRTYKTVLLKQEWHP